MIHGVGEIRPEEFDGRRVCRCKSARKSLIGRLEWERIPKCNTCRLTSALFYHDIPEFGCHCTTERKRRSQNRQFILAQRPTYKQGQGAIAGTSRSKPSQRTRSGEGGEARELGGRCLTALRTSPLNASCKRKIFEYGRPNYAREQT
jgi:hypothetical protein